MIDKEALNNCDYELSWHNITSTVIYSTVIIYKTNLKE